MENYKHLQTIDALTEYFQKEINTLLSVLDKKEDGTSDPIQDQKQDDLKKAYSESIKETTKLYISCLKIQNTLGKKRL